MKAFLEDGGGFDRIWNGAGNFLKRFRRSRYAPLLGMLVIVIMMITVVLVVSLGELNDTLRNNDLLIHLQREAGLPESAGLSEAEFEDMNNIFDALTWFWPVERSLNDYQDRHGYIPFSDEERALLTEFDHRYYRFENQVRKAEISLSAWIGICTCISRWLIRDKQDKRFILAAVLGMGIGLIPVIFVWAKLACDFAGTVHSILQPLFSTVPDPMQLESGLLVSLFPESVLRGIAENAAYHIGLSLMIIFAVLFAATLIVVVVDVVSKRNKLKEERE